VSAKFVPAAAVIHGALLSMFGWQFHFDFGKPENYRGINLLNTCYKIFSKILNKKLKNISEDFLLECQNGFRKGRSCTDSAFCMKLLIEKRREFNLETHFAFVDYEKAFDKVRRQKLFNVLKEQNIPNLLLKKYWKSIQITQ
jgi:hypothetical protein